MTTYDPHAVERKWRERWDRSELYRAHLDDDDRELCYCLAMFSYPSGERLHVGHWYNYSPTDTWARFRRMQGANVFQPMGFDSFGLPSENYAIQENVHPARSTRENTGFMTEQLKVIGAMYDWSYHLETHEPEFYAWDQWLFLELFRSGLAYRGEAPVNWCDGCQTVLANEQVVGGACERCAHPVRRRNLVQWFFRITAFADDLLEGLDRIDWPERTKLMQRNWIGRSEGALIHFRIDADRALDAFTTRPDTLWGVTYMVMAPEHALVGEITTESKRAEVEAYVEAAARSSDIERTSTTRAKTGVWTGAYAVNPVNDERVPVWVADYVLASYGTGAVMAVPGHDQRDFEFAVEQELPIRRVILDATGDPDAPLEAAFVEDGAMCRSGEFDGLVGEAARRRVIESLEASGAGEPSVHYRLRDWLISRQRYWGAPIPIVHCPECGEVPLPEDELPLLLPEDVEFKPTGESPLARHPTWKDVDCPACGRPARRETDTMDTFVDSSWYFLRYLSPRRDDVPWDSERAKRWMPVDQYVGGSEHAVLHLLYARFIMKALHRLGHVDCDEPFARLVHQGSITCAGARMSKSRGNVVQPEGYLEQYGSDTLRAYMMFGFAYLEGGDWDDSGIHAVSRYLHRVYRFAHEHREALSAARERDDAVDAGALDELRFARHHSIKGATQDLDRFQFNTAISRHMEFTNALYAFAHTNDPGAWGREVRGLVEDWVRLIAPFAPHLGEELWELIGGSQSVFDERWPEWDEAVLQRDEITVVVQVNGKVRDRMLVARGLPDEELAARARDHGRIPDWIGDKQVRKVVVVPDKLVNIVV